MFDTQVETPPEVTDTNMPDLKVDETKAELETLKVENERIKAELEQAKKIIPSVQPSADVSSKMLEGLSVPQWEQLETQTGKTRDQIMLQVKSVEYEKTTKNLMATTNVRDAIADKVEENPRLTQLKPAIREYLDSLPIEEKADTVKLKQHMDRAIFYAKGKYMDSKSNTTNANGKPNVDNPPAPDSSVDTPKNDLRQGEIKKDFYQDDKGFKITIGEIASIVGKDGVKKNISHPDDPNGVMFRGL